MIQIASDVDLRAERHRAPLMREGGHGNAPARIPLTYQVTFGHADLFEEHLVKFGAAGDLA